ncbi:MULTISPECIES: carboxymuconolactone decarboxylase family protein [unclassified Streptomyces]|uniref:carboxymuconolactone decarboxylase family protein n=1 Tax=unclassified Streptomyces TaxID=2593676 RepID=UPI002E8084D4|nr:carboxymuconolactone decarboxylase family protein [Streptomyces sp. NBC_00589]WTI41566.1 carboxymuconolactone decarboxylase family protein [Streptomyces sp. NBC_00775]WUB24751.1 carboxymuconolactone decarboxylase family protein [Streptomyces sp. NBC_00589]
MQQPADHVFTEVRMRLRPLIEMNPRQADLVERMVNQRGGVKGPFTAFLRSPELCELVEELGTYCTRGSALPLRLRELTLLIAARHCDAQHSWNAHVDKGIDAGLDPAALHRLAHRQDPQFGEADERALHRFATEVLEHHFVGDETYAEALEHFGERGLVDLLAALGCFSMFAMVLNAFQVDLQPDREPPFPDIEGFTRVAVRDAL